MEKLLEDIEKIKESAVRDLVKTRIKEFEETGCKTEGEIFKELCFCILTANFKAQQAIKIWLEIGDGFLTLPESQLTERLKELGHRFPRVRAEYIVKARKYAYSLKDIVKSFKNEMKLREWLVKNVDGLGYKEASHFLRNIGFKDFAIIDFHILDILSRYGIIKKPKALTKTKYLEIEGVLRNIARKMKLSLAELDLYLWYMETGKVLK